MAIAQAAIADVTRPDQHAREFGMLGAFVAIGFVVGPGLAAISALGGLRLPFVVAAVFGVLNLVLALARFPDTRALQRPLNPPRATSPSPSQPLSVRWFCLWAFGIAVFAFSAFEATFALVGKAQHGLGASGVGLSFVIVGVVMAIIEGRAIGPMMRHFGPTVMIALGAAFLAGGIALIGVSHTTGALGAGLVAIGIGYGSVSPVLTAAVVQTASTHQRAGVLGWQQSVSSLARVVGPIVGSMLLARSGARLNYEVVGISVALLVLPLVSSRFRVLLNGVRSSARFADSGT